MKNKFITNNKDYFKIGTKKYWLIIYKHTNPYILFVWDFKCKEYTKGVYLY